MSSPSARTVPLRRPVSVSLRTRSPCHRGKGLTSPPFPRDVSRHPRLSMCLVPNSSCPQQVRLRSGPDTDSPLSVLPVRQPRHTRACTPMPSSCRSIFSVLSPRRYRPLPRTLNDPLTPFVVGWKKEFPQGTTTSPLRSSFHPRRP